MLHDIGKLSVSNAILEKPGKLDEEEWDKMKMHPVYTKVIVQKITGFENMAFVAGAHHERLDGKGYPEGLSAEKLPLTARILCVADVYQALTEKRPYRESLPKNVVLGMMEKDSSTRLDSQCLDVLKQTNSSTDVAARQKAHAAGK